jgi:basic amino acid/polyamine antiporter, APA family
MQWNPEVIGHRLLKPASMTNNNSRQVIGFGAAVSFVIGGVIGSGIFMKPATMAGELGSPLWLIAVWIIGGVFTMIGALIYSEIGAMLPRTGGLYVYLRFMYGDFVAFLYGWAAFTVINTASVSAIAFVCAAYADYFFHMPRLSPAMEKSFVWHIPYLGNLYPLANLGVKSLAIALVVGITGLNYITTRGSSVLQFISTVLKIAVIVALVAGIFFSGNGHAENFILPSPVNPKHGWLLIGGIIGAMTSAFMAYDGWINLTFVGGEIINPQKNIPRSLITGVFGCIIIYVLLNLAFLYVLPIDQVAASSLVASDAIARALGNTSGAIIAGMIVICTFGAINSCNMSEARVTYTMSRDNLFFSWAGKEHPRFRTPGNALLMHGVLACLFILSGSFDMLADIFTFVAWLFYLLGAIGIFILRKKMPEMPRPYRVWAYPWLPMLFILFAAFYVISTIWNDVNNYISGTTPVVNSLLGLAITSLGIPLYLYFKKNRKGLGEEKD